LRERQNRRRIGAIAYRQTVARTWRLVNNANPGERAAKICDGNRRFRAQTRCGRLPMQGAVRGN